MTWDSDELLGRIYMERQQILRVVGVVMVCVGIHFGLGGLLPLIVFGAGLLCLYL